MLFQFNYVLSNKGETGFGGAAGAACARWDSKGPGVKARSMYAMSEYRTVVWPSLEVVCFPDFSDSHNFNHVSSDFITTMIHNKDPDGFDFWEPMARKVQRFSRFLGTNKRWSADGHDKLNQILNMSCCRWCDGEKHGAWLVPGNRHTDSFLVPHGDVGWYVSSYVLLFYFNDFLDIPMQFTTDYGSKTTTRKA